MDDKGVALIFAFGLPGSSHPGHSKTCAMAAHSVLKALEIEGMQFSAGLTRGAAFVGLTGDPSRRCEYTIMGGKANEAAADV